MRKKSGLTQVQLSIKLNIANNTIGQYEKGRRRTVSVKPVVCIVNVKAAISENKNLKLAIRDINKRFDKMRLYEIHKQFLQYSKQLDQDWGYVPFVNVHLKSAFLAQNIEDQVTAESLYNLSRMENLKKNKKRIVDLVRNKGEFYRVKTFIDIVLWESLQKIKKKPVCSHVL